MAQLKQNTAYTRCFFMAATGLSPSVQIAKAGAGFGAAAGSVNEMTLGWYKIALTTGDTDTLGDLAYHITAAGAEDIDMVDQIVSVAAGELTATERAAVADKLLGRNLAGGSDGNVL